MQVTLEDLYKGKSVKLAVTRDVMTVDPHGPIMNRQTGERYAKKSERQVLEVLIERGMKDGQSLRFEGKGDVMPGTLPGDVVLVIKEREHAVFQRKGADLIIKKEITLLEALTGEREGRDGGKQPEATVPRTRACLQSCRGEGGGGRARHPPRRAPTAHDAAPR